VLSTSCAELYRIIHYLGSFSSFLLLPIKRKLLLEGFYVNWKDKDNETKLGRQTLIEWLVAGLVFGMCSCAV